MPLKKLKPFITPLSPSGLPIAWETIPYDGKETCLNFTPPQLAKLYWLTESIHIHYHLLYSYKNTQETHQGTIHLTCPSLPHERIATPPIFEYESTTDDPFRAFAQLDLYNVSHRVPFQNRYGFSFEFFFENTQNLHTLAFSNRDYNQTMVLKATANVSFMQHAFPAYLYTTFPEASASIQDFQIIPHFYEYN